MSHSKANSHIFTFHYTNLGATVIKVVAVNNFLLDSCNTVFRIIFATFFSLATRTTFIREGINIRGSMCYLSLFHSVVHASVD